MVVALGPGKFYGSSLPRPRIYTDVKFNDDRVDPPVPVLDPLMSWAEEAHWSMGGMNIRRHRLQGRIEGNIKKLRAEREKFFKKRKQSDTDQIGTKSAPRGANRSASPSPPPAPMATKRRRFMALIEEDEDEDERELKGGDEGVGVRVRRRPARKLWDDFDRVASESGLGKSRESPLKSSSGGSDAVASRTRSRRSEEGDGGVEMKAAEVVNKSNSKGKKLKLNGKAKRVADKAGSTPLNGTRVSPRLAKRGLR